MSVYQGVLAISSHSPIYILGSNNVANNAIRVPLPFENFCLHVQG